NEHHDRHQAGAAGRDLGPGSGPFDDRIRGRLPRRRLPRSVPRGQRAARHDGGDPGSHGLGEGRERRRQGREPRRPPAVARARRRALLREGGVSGMKVLAISGSLRRDSYNTKLLRAAEELLPADVELEFYEGLKAVPPYDEEDDVQPAPPAVAALRQAVADAD